MSISHDIAVIIGRFQPYHLGHVALVKQALDIAPKVVIVLGSAHQARDAKNPFTWQERAAMIRATLDDASAQRVAFVAVRDYYDDRRWVAAVQAAIQPHAPHGHRVALIGRQKDSYYLNRFSGWSLISDPPANEIDASSLRSIFLECSDPAASRALLSQLVSPTVIEYLQGWAHLPPYARMREEHLALIEYRKRWGSGPFVTVDAVVTAAEHVLLVRRKHTPGKGLWALPGGFLEAHEWILQGAMRELREETGLAALDSTLEAALKAKAVFDHPGRSLRGRTITHAHYFALQHSRIPEVCATDDAASAEWIAISDLGAIEDQFFEDHFHILNHFLDVTSG